MLEIDGSHGEGGGQILRTSLTLSALTRNAVRVADIRARRSKPGLAPQHLTNVLAIAAICGAEIRGAELGSTRVEFRPRSEPRAGEYRFDVADVAQGGSAGSVTLILQTLLVPLALAGGESRLTLSGGTHVAWSPPFDYLAHVYLPALGRMGLRAVCHLEAWGFYPAGGGRVTAVVGKNHPAGQGLEPLRLSAKGSLQRIRGKAVACSLPAHIAQRMARRAESLLRNAKTRGGPALDVQVSPRRVSGAGPGAVICLIAEYQGGSCGFSAIGRIGKSSEAVAEEACRLFEDHHRGDATVDVHLADQLLLPMALAHGRSEFRTTRVTRHLLTNAHVIRQFIPARIDIDAAAGQPGTVLVEGVGLS